MTSQTSHSHTPGDIAEVAQCPSCGPLLARITAAFCRQTGDTAAADRLEAEAAQ